MKVKDVRNDWLLVWNSKPSKKVPLMTKHFFVAKTLSLCGKVRHPTKQPMVAYIQHDFCPECLIRLQQQGEKTDA